MGQEPATQFIYGIAPTKVAVETQQAIDDGFRIVVNQGGTRSGKTYSLTDLMIGTAFATPQSISICSISLPHLKKGARRDWRELMESKGGYNPAQHNMTDQIYRYPTGGYIEFFSVDDAKRVRGPGRDVLYINEANLLSRETWRQLILRTKKTIIIDYNPADEFHWIYDDVIPRKDCKFIQSTYQDNPFLSKEQIREIEMLREIDPNFWRVYGLGERGTAEATIYKGFQIYSKEPYLQDWCFGLDFGFNHPNALVKVGIHEKSLYLEQKFYRSHTTTPELIQEIKPIVGRKSVFCDSARPEIIEELRRAGINSWPADKSVKEGIDFIRSHHVHVHQESVDLQKEFRSYKWKVKPNGQVLDEPVKLFDDLLDAARYGAMSYKKKTTAPVFGVHR